jgi:hypothetical protein
MTQLFAPFPYFGGKRDIAAAVWARLGKPKQYIEPFCGSAAILLAKPGQPAALEVVCDANGFIANFWRAVKHQPGQVAEWADYPISHIDMGARHGALMAARETLAGHLHDPDWPGDAKIAGWWLWGQCSWIGSGWCEWDKAESNSVNDQIPHVGAAGRGVQAIGQIPHLSDAGLGVQAIGKRPQLSNAGMMTSAGRTAWEWLHRLAGRLERVRIVHGDWPRCLNHHLGGENTAVFLDPPYLRVRAMYGTDGATSIAHDVCVWARDNARLRIALCGHAGDYALPGWETERWSRSQTTYGSDKTKDDECVWYSPGCLPARETARQLSLFDTADDDRWPGSFATVG